MVVVLQAVFVAHHLPVEFVDQFIHGGVQIRVGAFCKHVTAFDVNVAFGALPSFLFLLFFDGEKHFDIDYLVKVAGDSI